MKRDLRPGSRIRSVSPLAVRKPLEHRLVVASPYAEGVRGPLAERHLALQPAHAENQDDLTIGVEIIELDAGERPVGHPVPHRCLWQVLQPGGGEQVPRGNRRRVCAYQVPAANERAIPRPRPRLAPTTTVVLPDKSLIIVLFHLRVHGFGGAAFRRRHGLLYSSWRRIQTCHASPSSRPFGARSRIG
jgi:hypothetical protein